MLFKGIASCWALQLIATLHLSLTHFNSVSFYLIHMKGFRRKPWIKATVKDQPICLFRKNPLCFVSISDLPCKSATIQRISLDTPLPFSTSPVAFYPLALSLLSCSCDWADEWAQEINSMYLKTPLYEAHVHAEWGRDYGTSKWIKPGWFWSIHWH